MAKWQPPWRCKIGTSSIKRLDGSVTVTSRKERRTHAQNLQNIEFAIAQKYLFLVFVPILEEQSVELECFLGNFVGRKQKLDDMTASFRLNRKRTVILPGLNGERRAVLGEYIFATAILQDGLSLNDLEIFILARVEMKRGLLLEEALAFHKIEGDMKRKVSIWMVNHPRTHSSIET